MKQGPATAAALSRASSQQVFPQLDKVRIHSETSGWLGRAGSGAIVAGRRRRGSAGAAPESHFRPWPDRLLGIRHRPTASPSMLLQVPLGPEPLVTLFASERAVPLLAGLDLELLALAPAVVLQVQSQSIWVDLDGTHWACDPPFAVPLQFTHLEGRDVTEGPKHRILLRRLIPPSRFLFTGTAATALLAALAAPACPAASAADYAVAPGVAIMPGLGLLPRAAATATVLVPPATAAATVLVTIAIVATVLVTIAIAATVLVAVSAAATVLVAVSAAAAATVLVAVAAAATLLVVASAAATVLVAVSAAATATVVVAPAAASARAPVLTSAAFAAAGVTTATVSAVVATTAAVSAAVPVFVGSAGSAAASFSTALTVAGLASLELPLRPPVLIFTGLRDRVRRLLVRLVPGVPLLRRSQSCRKGTCPP